ncbi:citrate/2-methylcitrate synthase [Thermospira aquatica]|uniref:Citrate synthase n=1 Tax=Thermospira aquatica TaxID=2828656 RepID=A0AAX3BG98_9SPIR|nr:citrate/2-methylcitrate synthase [Thermospira aquatica]
MQPKDLSQLTPFTSYLETNNVIPNELYTEYNVKRGLRNTDGTGVLVGLTHIGEVHGYVMDEGVPVPVEGRLRYRGIDIFDLVEGFQKENRYGFEETVFLLLFGQLPTKKELEEFSALLARYRQLPDGFKENIILKSPSPNIMNLLTREVSALYAYDPEPDDISVANVLDQCLQLIAQFPAMVAYGYHAKRHYYENESLFLHHQSDRLAHVENFLSLLRPNREFDPIEAHILDLAFVLHAEHGGGNNSTFTLHVVSSTNTDTYSAIVAALCSLKGPRHGGANAEVVNMMDDVKKHIKDWSNENEIKDYIRKLLNKEAYDRRGLIYGMGHAVYSLSDPRAILLKKKAEELARYKKREEEFHLYDLFERFSRQLFAEKAKNKIICANVDFYAGFVYDMLGIPRELYTPLFALSRMAGWSAHRLEELIAGGRIIRPAYKCISEPKEYVPLDRR